MAPQDSVYRCAQQHADDRRIVKRPRACPSLLTLLHSGACAERGPPIDQVIQSGIIPRLVQFLTAIDENGDAIPQLQALSPPARTRYCPSL